MEIDDGENDDGSFRANILAMDNRVKSVDSLTMRGHLDSIVPILESVSNGSRKTWRSEAFFRRGDVHRYALKYNVSFAAYTK